MSENSGETVLIYVCPLDHYQIECTIGRVYRCPICGTVMRFETTRKRQK